MSSGAVPGEEPVSAGVRREALSVLKPPPEHGREGLGDLTRGLAESDEHALWSEFKAIDGEPDDTSERGGPQQVDEGSDPRAESDLIKLDGVPDGLDALPLGQRVQFAGTGMRLAKSPDPAVPPSSGFAN